MKKESAEKEMKHHDNSAGIVGLILGILAILYGGMGFVLGFVGFWFSLRQFKHGKNKWASWGLALNIIGFVMGLIILIYFGVYLADAVSNLQGIPG